MTVTTVNDQARAAGRTVWSRDFMIAAAVAAFIFATYAAAGFPTLDSPRGDNDSLLRLVEVRDLLAGQAWYDLKQYRMGPEGGFVMHWSRLVDAPLAALVIGAGVLGAGSVLAETIAITLWPFLLMSVTLAGLIALGRSLGGASAILPAAALGAGALYFVGIYQPGSIDHHNVQIALTVWVLVFLIRSPGRRRLAASAGVCAALMLAIGMEAAPYVAVACLCAAASWLVSGDEDGGNAAAFGASFAAVTAAAFMATVSPRDWAMPACDALSNVQTTLAAVGGIGLALIATWPAVNASLGRRCLALGGLGALVLSVTLIAFPQCLGDPYATIDPRLRELWLNGVTEAQSVADLAGREWTMLLAYFATPFIGFFVLARALLRDRLTRARMLHAAFLLAALLVSCWQLRGSVFAIPLAAAALAAGIGALRERIAAGSPAPLATLALALAWLLSFNISWSAAAGVLRAGDERGATQPSGGDCSSRSSFDHLAALPKGTVLAVSDLGSPILVNTPHRVLAGPYHRNVAGNLAMMDAMLSEPQAAEAVARTNKVDYVAICAGNPETRSFTARSPDGLMAHLANGRPPAWLILDAGTKGQAIEIYRVREENAK